MTDKLLIIFLIECKGIVDERPLLTVTYDFRDLRVLTLNELIISGDNRHRILITTSRERLVRQYSEVNHLSPCFGSDGTGSIFQFSRKDNFRSAGLALLFLDLSPWSRWPSDVIEDRKQSDHGLVRTATVCVVEGFARRNVRKLCIPERVKDTPGVVWTVNTHQVRGRPLCLPNWVGALEVETFDSTVCELPHPDGMQGTAEEPANNRN